jgi:predicted RNase H-like HicB family nuclease
MSAAEACGILQAMPGRWTVFSTKPYECVIYLRPDETGGFYAYLPMLPGVVGEGDTDKEAIENTTEAFRGAVMAYRESGAPIPWKHEIEVRPSDARELRIVVNA